MELIFVIKYSIQLNKIFLNNYKKKLKNLIKSYYNISCNDVIARISCGKIAAIQWKHEPISLADRTKEGFIVRVAYVNVSWQAQ